MWSKICKCSKTVKESESECVFHWLYDPAELSPSAPSSWIFTSRHNIITIFNLPHFTFFFLLHLLLLKRLFFFFFSSRNWVGSQRNEHFTSQISPGCSGKFITPKHHSFSLTYGFIYTKTTSLTPINTKNRRRLFVRLSYEFLDLHEEQINVVLGFQYLLHFQYEHTHTRWMKL